MLLWIDKISDSLLKTILTQTIFWAFFISYEILLSRTLGAKTNFLDYALHYGLYIALFYIHTYGILLKTLKAPHYRYLMLIAGIAAELILFYIGLALIYIVLNPQDPDVFKVFISTNSFAAMIYRFGYVLGLSTTYWLGISSIKQQKHLYQMKQEKLLNEIREKNLKANLLQTELAFLKAQIQPHFLFNSLNKIYYQVRDSAPASAAILMELASLLKFNIILDKNQQNIKLGEELVYIQNYINLQRVLKPIYLNFNLSKETIDNAADTLFPPLILATIVENIFKHGELHQEEKPANLVIRLHQNKLRIRVTNNILKRKSNANGIGLQNIKDRLGHLFPKNYHIHVKQYRCSYNFKLFVLLNPHPL